MLYTYILALEGAIVISDDYYGALKRLKRPGESFSEVIRRLLRHKEGSLLDLVGSDTITEEGLEALEEYRRAVLKAERLRRLLKAV